MYIFCNNLYIIHDKLKHKKNIEKLLTKHYIFNEEIKFIIQNNILNILFRGINIWTFIINNDELNCFLNLKESINKLKFINTTRDALKYNMHRKYIYVLRLNRIKLPLLPIEIIKYISLYLWLDDWNIKFYNNHPFIE